MSLSKDIDAAYKRNQQENKARQTEKRKLKDKMEKEKKSKQLFVAKKGQELILRIINTLDIIQEYILECWDSPHFKRFILSRAKNTGQVYYSLFEPNKQNARLAHLWIEKYTYQPWCHCETFQDSPPEPETAYYGTDIQVIFELKDSKSGPTLDKKNFLGITSFSRDPNERVLQAQVWRIKKWKEELGFIKENPSRVSLNEDIGFWERIVTSLEPLKNKGAFVEFLRKEAGFRNI